MPSVHGFILAQSELLGHSHTSFKRFSQIIVWFQLADKWDANNLKKLCCAARLNPSLWGRCGDDRTRTLLCLFAFQGAFLIGVYP